MAIRRLGEQQMMSSKRELNHISEMLNHFCSDFFLSLSPLVFRPHNIRGGCDCADVRMCVNDNFDRFGADFLLVSSLRLSEALPLLIHIHINFLDFSVYFD